MDGGNPKRLSASRPFPLHLLSAGNQKHRLQPLVKIQRARLVKIQYAPTSHANQNAETPYHPAL